MNALSAYLSSLSINKHVSIRWMERLQCLLTAWYDEWGNPTHSGSHIYTIQYQPHLHSTYLNMHGINGKLCRIDGRRFCVRFSGYLWSNFTLSPYSGTVVIDAGVSMPLTCSLDADRTPFSFSWGAAGSITFVVPFWSAVSFEIVPFDWLIAFK